jgi:hypothetical protein
MISMTEVIPQEIYQGNSEKVNQNVECRISGFFCLYPISALFTDDSRVAKNKSA